MMVHWQLGCGVSGYCARVLFVVEACCSCHRLLCVAHAYAACIYNTNQFFAISRWSTVRQYHVVQITGTSCLPALSCSAIWSARYALALDSMSSKVPDMNFLSKRTGLPYGLQWTLRHTLPRLVHFEMYLGKFGRDEGLVQGWCAGISEPVASASVQAFKYASALASLVGILKFMDLKTTCFPMAGIETP